MRFINSRTVPTGLAATALFVAAGGPATAQSLITGKQIRNSSITGADVKNNSLTSSDVKGLRRSDFASGQLPSSTAGTNGPAGPRGATGANGATGAPGAKGDKGDKGDAGAQGPSRWLLVDATGAIVGQSGGFRIANAYPTTPAGANGNVYISAGEDLSDNGIIASIALQNQVNQDGVGDPTGPTGNAGANPGADANPEFSGEITATMCAITGVVACAPLDTGTADPADTTNNRSTFVVSPRLSDAQRTADGASPTPANPANRKRFYIQITGTSPATFTNNTPAVAIP